MSTPKGNDVPDALDLPPGGEAVQHVTAALKGLRFGQVTITVQDGVVVQIDRTERRRLGRNGN